MVPVRLSVPVAASNKAETPSSKLPLAIDSVSPLLKPLLIFTCAELMVSITTVSASVRVSDGAMATDAACSL